MAQWKLKEETMIAIGLIQHISTGRILIMDLASVGMKSTLKLKSVSILLTQEPWVCCFSYYYTFDLYFTVNVLFSTFFSIFYISVRTLVFFLSFASFMQTPGWHNLLWPVHLQILYLACIVLVLFSAWTVTHSCLWITLVTVTGWTIIWFYMDSCFQSHWPVVTRKILDIQKMPLFIDVFTCLRRTDHIYEIRKIIKSTLSSPLWRWKRGVKCHMFQAFISNLKKILCPYIKVREQHNV